MTDSWFAVTGGAKLFVRKWAPESGVRGIIQIVHGMREHSLRYERLAVRLCEAGFEVWAADMRGHGRTADLKVNDPSQGGQLGHCADRRAVARLVSDIHLINLAIHKQYPGLPLFLMGHSWGSFLAQAYIERYSELRNAPRLAGCILSGTRGPDGGVLVQLGGPFLALLSLFHKRRGKSRLAVALADGAYAKAFAPARTPLDWLSSDTDAVDAYIADPLCGQMPSLGFYRDLAFTLRQIHRKKNMERIPLDLPVYVFSGSRDPVGNMGESPRALVEWYTTHGMDDVGFVLYPDARHEMLHETNYTEVQENLLAWINKHITSSIKQMARE
ncbi:MAG: alpha/beta hydrolase [Spirochaetaceae bacterium]|jgi:alpha-beta hydrolase superfamily lysophospholipase|nr:alpha/beta hydrolase [Spirochaetaceae bacterium]